MNSVINLLEVIEMNKQQSYMGPSFYVGWMRGALVYDNSLSPSPTI